jgi:hypothetical protein
MRVTLATGHWHLYWWRKFDAWWPYPPPERGAHSTRYTLSARLRQVLADEHGCFWLITLLRNRTAAPSDPLLRSGRSRRPGSGASENSTTFRTGATS